MSKYEIGDMDADVVQVVDTAALLSVSEYRLFHLAYGHWYGEEAGREEIEGAFRSYLLDDVVPPWVRSFTRRVVELEKHGTLDPADLGVAEPEVDRSDVARGRFYLLAVTLALILLVLLADNSAGRLGIEGCVFPPCY